MDILHGSTLQVCFNPTALWSTTVPRQKQQSSARFPDSCCCAFTGPVDIPGNLAPICVRHWPTFQVRFTPAARWDSWIHKKYCNPIPRPLSSRENGCCALIGSVDVSRNLAPIYESSSAHFDLGLGHVKRDLPEIGSTPLLYCGAHRFLVRLTYYFPLSFCILVSLLIPASPADGLSEVGTFIDI